MIAERISWRPGIGDPTVIGWVTVIAYGVAALLCLRAGLRIRRKQVQSQVDPPAPWFVFAAALLFLGLNKQLDLQTLLIQAGRQIALAGGWYANRRAAEAVFFFVASAIVVASLFFVGWRTRQFFKRHPSALVGSFLLLSYLLLRSASIEHLDEALGLNLEDRPWMAAIELSGIICFAVAGLQTFRAAS